jgi:hypothetical protein
MPDKNAGKQKAPKNAILRGFLFTGAFCLPGLSV